MKKKIITAIIVLAVIAFGIWLFDGFDKIPKWNKKSVTFATATATSTNFSAGGEEMIPYQVGLTEMSIQLKAGLRASAVQASNMNVLFASISERTSRLETNQNTFIHSLSGIHQIMGVIADTLQNEISNRVLFATSFPPPVIPTKIGSALIDSDLERTIDVSKVGPVSPNEDRQEIKMTLDGNASSLNGRMFPVIIQQLQGGKGKQVLDITVNIPTNQVAPTTLPPQAVVTDPTVWQRQAAAAAPSYTDPPLVAYSPPQYPAPVVYTSGAYYSGYRPVSGVSFGVRIGGGSHRAPVVRHSQHRPYCPPPPCPPPRGFHSRPTGGQSPQHHSSGGSRGQSNGGSTRPGRSR